MLRWHGLHRFDKIEAESGLLVAPPTTDYFVDTTNGSDSNAGTSWALALATIAAAFTKAATLASRGRVRIFVAPGGYTEDLSTPLNTTQPFGQLIAWNPTPRQSFGAVYLTASTAGVQVLTVRARGWLIEGFEIDALADAECVVLDHKNTNCSAQGTELRNCLLCGQNQGLYGIDVIGGGAPHTSLIECGFYGFTSGSTAGKCIGCTDSAVDQPRFWIIEDCWFGDSDNLIDMNPRGFKESMIRRNTFIALGANQDPDEKLDNTGGSNNQIGPQNMFGGTYSNAGGYVAGTDDDWGGNFNSLSGGVTAADPA